MLPDSDLLYLREDEVPLYLELTDGNYPISAQHMYANQCLKMLGRLIAARKEIERLKIAAGEEISRVSIDGYANAQPFDEATNDD